MSEATHTLLVVDDELLNRDILSRRLTRAGYRVLVAEDGYRAIGMIETEAVDLVLLDIMMPGIDGIRVLEKLRSRHSMSELPVVMASAVGESETVVKALGAGANDYVTKPLDFPVVLARVESLLRQRAEVPRRDEPSPAEIGLGAVLDRRYRLDAVLGEGGFGTVYRAHHLELELDVAVKLLHADMVRNPNVLARFRREGISTCRVQHPNAVLVYDFHASESGTAYLVMELLRGVSLATALERSGPLSPARCAEILTPVCDVLSEVHAAGIVHRDIKPENVFLHETPRGEVVKVLDFGIAGLVEADDAGDRLTNRSVLLGTPRYMAPERLFGEPHDGRSDVYSLGVLLFRMLTGEEPFAGFGPRAVSARHGRGELPQLPPEVPRPIAEVVACSLSKDPDDRPDAAALARAFAAALPE